MSESPASLLERAAQRLEELALIASPAPWQVDVLGICDASGKTELAAAPNQRVEYGEPVSDMIPAGDAAWIAAMNPVVAAPLVEWLRFARVAYEMAERRAANKSWDATDNHVDSSHRAALAFSRLILGTPVPGEDE